MASDVIDRLKTKTNKIATNERLLVTPEIAKAWLDQNVSNRKIVKNHVDKLTRDMVSGEFEFTGDPIRFDWNKRLIDGQHRLLACVAADRPFESLVIYNLPPETQKKMDTGRPRLASDMLSLTGLHYATTLSSACRLILTEKNGDTVRSTTYTTTEILGVLDKHKKLPASINAVRTSKIPKGISGAQLAVMHYIASHILNAPNVADQFVEVIKTGIPTYDGDAAHTFRERRISSHGTGRESRDNGWRVMKHAWNLFALGKPAKVMRGAADVQIDGLNLKDL